MYRSSQENLFQNLDIFIWEIVVPFILMKSVD